MAYCCKCGIQLNDKAKFCPKCGHPTGISTKIKERKSLESEPIIEYKGTSSNSKDIIWVILAVLLIGIAGYYGIKQYKYMSQKQAEIQRQKENDEKVRKALGLDNYSRSLNLEEVNQEREAGSRHIEVDNNPCSSFYCLACLNQFVWEARNHYFDVPGIDVLYFYPVSKSEGYVSVTRHEPDYNSWYPTFSVKTNYRIIGDNSITFSASGVGGLRREPWATNYIMTIEKDGNEIRLVNHDNLYGKNYTIVYSQKKKPIEDPLSK